MAVVKIIRMRYWCNVLLNTFSFFFFYLRRDMYRVADLNRIPEVLTYLFVCLESRKHLIYLILQQNERAAM